MNTGNICFSIGNIVLLEIEDVKESHIPMFQAMGYFVAVGPIAKKMKPARNLSASYALYRVIDKILSLQSDVGVQHRKLFWEIVVKLAEN